MPHDLRIAVKNGDRRSLVVDSQNRAEVLATAQQVKPKAQATAPGEDINHKIWLSRRRRQELIGLILRRLLARSQDKDVLRGSAAFQPVTVLERGIAAHMLARKVFLERRQAHADRSSG